VVQSVRAWLTPTPHRRADYAQDELIQPDRDYRPYLTGRQATGGLREYGERVADTWEREVERALAG
jgi:hypothetical protein